MSTDTERDKLDFLWTEYKYRHDLCWRSVIQLTAAATALAILPYVEERVVLALGFWVLLVPCLGLALVAFGWAMMVRELKSLERVKEAYRRLQRSYLGAVLPELSKPMVPFSGRVLGYVTVLFVLGAASIPVTAYLWIPFVRNSL